jgi:hypothetical protein
MKFVFILLALTAILAMLILILWPTLSWWIILIPIVIIAVALLPILFIASVDVTDSNELYKHQ